MPALVNISLKRVAPLGLAACAAVLLPARSAADIGVEGAFLEIEASSAAGAASLRIELEEAGWTGGSMSLSYQLPEALDLIDPDSGAVIARLRAAKLSMLRCGRIDLSFEADAGASLTEFRFRSGGLYFPQVESAAAEAKAKATFTIRDMDNNYAHLLGLGTPGTGAYFARFNGRGDGAPQFSNLVASAYISGGGTATAWQNDPPSGYRAAGASVESLSVDLGFTLTPNDRVTLSSSFDLIPDPSDCDADDDGDALPNWLDGCPQDPAKAWPGACGCGEADLDADSDGIADCDDNCPDMFNPDQLDANADGVGDACAGASDPIDDDPMDDDPLDEGDAHPHDLVGGGSNPAGEDADAPDSRDNPALVAGDRAEFEGAGDSGDAGDEPGDGPGAAAGEDALAFVNEIVPAGCGAGAFGLMPVMAIGLLGGRSWRRPRA